MDRFTADCSGEAKLNGEVRSATVLGIQYRNTSRRSKSEDNFTHSMHGTDVASVKVIFVR